jgi:tetratricopeptide (TPR) repeat protein
MSRTPPPLLLRIDELSAREDWDALVRAIGEAQAAGLTRSMYGVPLDFLLEEARISQGRAADARADALVAEGEDALAQGNANRAQRRFAQALVIPHITPPCERRVRARIERLETQLRNYAAGSYNVGAYDVDAGQVEPHSETLLAELRTARPTMYRLLALCAVPRWLDADLVSVLRQKDDGREEEVLARINDFSFVYPWESDRYTLSEDVRRRFLVEWQQTPEEYRAINARLADHFHDRVANDPPRNPARLERLRQAELYHTFLADPAAGAALLGRYFQEAEDGRQLVSARQYVVVLQELQGQIPPEYFAYVEYAEGWFHHLQGNENAAHAILSELETQADLAPDLQARVARAAGAVHVAQGAWIDGLAAFEDALAAFERQGNEVEVAETMVQMGGAYLDIAASAMGEYDPIMEEYTGRHGALSVGALLVRLPLILYLLAKLRIRWPLPNLFRFGQGLDWVIARLFADAIVWLDRAEHEYESLGNVSGVNRTRETLGRLYWILNDPGRAVTYLEPLQNAYAENTFPRAQVALKLAEAYLAQGRMEEAKALIVSALAVFEQVGERARSAQCHNRLGYIAEQEGAPAQAVAEYTAALNAWRETGNEIRVTQMLHRLEHIDESSALPEADRAAIGALQETVLARTYATRYVHPVSLFYQRAAVISFAVLIGLLSLINIEIQPQIDLQSSLILDASKLERMNFTLDQSVSQGITLNVSPTPALLFFAVFFAVLLFVLLYAAVGAYFVRRAPLLALQQSNAERIQLDETGILYTSGSVSAQVPWSELARTTYSTRRFCREAIDIFSVLALATDRIRLEIDGLTQGYHHVEEQIEARTHGAAELAETHLGVNFLCRGWGVVFTGTLLLQGLFLLVAIFWSDWLALTIPFLPYTFADFWNVIELGVALPLVYWLVVQPARFRIYAREARWNFGVLWFVALLSILLNFSPARNGYPAVSTSVISLFIGGYILYDSWRLRRLTREEADREQRPRRPLGDIALIFGTLVVMGLSVVALVTELGSFHYQALGYQQFRQTQDALNLTGPDIRRERAAAQSRVLDETEKLSRLTENPDQWLLETQESAQVNEEQARELWTAEVESTEAQLAQAQADLAGAQARLDTIKLGYEEARESFERALRWRKDARPYRLLAIANAFLGQYEEAIDVFEEMDSFWVVQSDRDRRLIAQVLHQGAFDLRGREQTDAWLQARDYYDALLENPSLSREDARRLERFRAALLVSLAGADQSRASGQAETLLRNAEALFERQITEMGNGDPAELAAAHAWLGTARLLRGIDADAEAGEREQVLAGAKDSFDESLRLNPDQLAAYNGLGWSLVYLSRITPDNCIAGFSDPALIPGYIEQITQAEDAFTRALALPAPATLSDAAGELRTKTRATYYRTRAQLRYILSHCDEDEAQRFDRATYLRDAIGDYRRALQLETRAEWFDRIGTLREEYATYLNRENLRGEAAVQQRLATREYAEAIALDQGYFATRKRLYDLLNGVLQVDDPAADAIGLIAAALDEANEIAFLTKFAGEEYARGLTPLAAEAITYVLAQAPENRDAQLLAGPIYEQWALLIDEPERTERYELAREAAASALTLEPENPDQHLALGRALLGLGQVEAAQAELETALALAPDNVAVLYALAYADFRVGQEDAARARYAAANQAAAALDVPAAKPIYLRAVVELLRAPGDDVRAAADLAASIAEAALGHYGITEKDATALAELAREAQSARDYEQAIPIWVRAIQAAPRQREFWQSMRSGLILGPDLGQVASGDAVLTLLLGAFDQEEADALLEIARLDLAENVFGLAAAALERALTFESDNGDVYALLAETYARWGVRWNQNLRHAQAAEVLERATAAGIERAEVYLYAGSGLYGLGDEEGALAALSQAAALDPASVEGLSAIGRRASENGDYRFAAAVLEEALRLDDRNPGILFSLGLAHTALGEADAASAAYTAGIAAADGLEDSDERARIFSQAIEDLRQVDADPAGIALDLIELLEAGQERAD